jgi:PAS domain S-box-containing protein
VPIDHRASAPAVPPPAPAARRLRTSVAEGIAFFVLVAAGVRVLGWVANARGLLQPPIGTAPMLFATAACFVVTAAAMLMIGRGRQRGAQTLAIAVLCATAVFITLYLLDLHLGGRDLPVRLPPQTVAFAFALVQAGLLLRCVPDLPTWARHGVMACAATAVVVVIEAFAQQFGAAGALRAVYPVGDIQAETMLYFVLVAVAMVASIGPGARQPELDTLDRVAAWGTVLLAACVFLGWSRLETDFWRERIGDTTTASDAAVGGLREHLAAQSSALARFAERWDVYGGMTAGEFDKEAQMYLHDRPPIEDLMFAGPDFVVRWTGGRAERVDAAGVDLATDAARAAVFRSAAEQRAPRLTLPAPLRSGETGVMLVTPVASGRVLRGYLAAHLRLEAFVRASTATVQPDFGLSLRDQQGRLVAGDPQDVAAATWLVRTASLEALGERWTVAVWPHRAYLNRMRSGLPDAMFLVGLIAVMVVAAAFMQARRSAVSNLAARRMSQRLATTLESITDAFFTIGRDMKFTYVNPEAERLLQRTRDELAGRDLWAEFPDAVGTTFERSYRRALIDNCTVEFEEFYPPLGKWFAVKAYPSPEGLAVYFQDVTQRRHSQEAQRESERELSALAESMPQIVWMADLDGSTIYCNQRWLDFTGLSREETYGTGWARTVHPDDVQLALHTWTDARASGADFEVESRLRGRDGQYRWMLVRGVAHRDRDGRVTKWMGTCTDIDAMKQSADAVRASEQRFQLLARATNDGIWECDLTTGTVWWSEGFTALFGTRNESGATLERGLARIHPEDRESASARLQRAIDGDAQTWSAEYRFMRADGTFAHVLSRGSIIRDAAGRAVRLVGSMSDISERIGLEEQLRQSQRLEAVGHLTGGLAHDFNNLLTVVLGNAETLTDALAKDASLRPLAEMILAAAERGADLTQRLLAFSRQQALDPVAVDVEQQLDELEPLLRRTLGEHIEIVRPAHAGLWRALVDASQLDSALLNLCLNARDAMPYRGELRIEARNVELGADEASRHGGLAPGEYVAIAVIDTGCGIRPEHMGRVFEPFFTTKEKGKGTGLGLPMVYGFIRQSGGHVEVQSTLNEGTTVTLYLPRARGEQPRPNERAPQTVLTGRESILLVEDDFYVRTYARDQLRALGYRVVEAGSGPEAIEVLRGSEGFDLLLTDVVMPQMSGPELAVHAQALRPGLKVLYTSGYTDDALTHHGRFGSGVRLLAKPYLRDELARRVREGLLEG